MAEHTKGELTVSKIHDDGSVHLNSGKNKDYICSVQIEQIGGGAIASAMEETRMANAKHLLKCWNAFEEGGLVEKLIHALTVSPNNFPTKGSKCNCGSCTNWQRIKSKALAEAEKE